MDAALVIGVEGDSTRQAVARKMGADIVLHRATVDMVVEVKRITSGGDVASGPRPAGNVRERAAGRSPRQSVVTIV
jgi:NADPH:quinone reductase-like Zn-dependent oxidoreductase